MSSETASVYGALGGANVMRMEPSWVRLVSYKRGSREVPTLLHHMRIERRHQLWTRKRARTKSDHAGVWSYTSQSLELWGKKFMFFISHPGCSILLWQPRSTETLVKSLCMIPLLQSLLRLLIVKHTWSTLEKVLCVRGRMFSAIVALSIAQISVKSSRLTVSFKTSFWKPFGKLHTFWTLLCLGCVALDLCTIFSCSYP